MRMMAFSRVIALAFALGSSSVVWSSHPFKSARDQYEARQDRPQLQLLAEATDHRPEVHASQQTDFIKKSTNATRKQATPPDLQVGCGDGFIHEKLQQTSESDKNKIQQSKNTSVKRRRKRSYSPVSYQVSYTHPYQSISVWQPPVYQLSRPYFIPIYGVPGGVPIYYPPQPLYVNVGEPKDNPIKKPFKGPTYLPPVESTTTSTTMNVEDRFSGEDTSDDRPIWDVGESNQQTQRPPQGQTTVVPTRRPIIQSSKPPLVHNPTDPEGLEDVGSINENEITSTVTPTAATRPPPPLSVSQSRPQGRPNEPSRCVWAIISCCSATNLISYECFEQRGCPGAFWDSSPCDSEFAQAAISAALNYYNNK